VRRIVRSLPRVGIITAVLALGVAAVAAPALASDTVTLEGVIASAPLPSYGTTLELVLNYGPLQAVDVGALSPADQARLMDGEWVQLEAVRVGTGFQAQRVKFVGPCLEERDDRQTGTYHRCTPGSIHGSANASNLIATMLAPLTSSQVRVSEKEFSFTPAQAIVPAGQTVQITVTNNGTIEHNFTVELPDQIEQTLFATNLKPGETRTASFTFARAGAWQMYCPIDGHEDLGMKGTLTVVAGATGGASTPASAAAPTAPSAPAPPATPTSSSGSSKY